MLANVPNTKFHEKTLRGTRIVTHLKKTECAKRMRALLPLCLAGVPTVQNKLLVLLQKCVILGKQCNRYCNEQVLSSGSRAVICCKTA
jgi:hypothetical protein